MLNYLVSLQRMSMQVCRSAAGFVIGWLLVGRAVLAADVSLSIDAGNPRHAISPRLIGVFFEDINFGGDGGLNAELVKNGSFEFPDARMGWSETTAGENSDASADNSAKGRGTIEVADEGGPFAVNPHYLRIASANAG